MQGLIITLVQTRLTWEDPEANIAHFSNLLSSFDEPTDLIILPEMFNTGFTMAAADNAETMGGMTMRWMAAMAKEKDSVVCGSLIVEEDGQYYNRFLWMQADGKFEHYDKKHLFRMGDEHIHFSAGSKKLITEVKGWKVMPLICYDLRFPVWSKNSFYNEEYAYDLLIYVANWPAVRIEAWTSLLKGRAVENLAYAVGLNRIGTDGRGYEYSGGSLVAGPAGTPVSEVGIGNERILSVKLDGSELLNTRKRLGAGKDWDEFQMK